MQQQHEFQPQSSNSQPQRPPHPHLGTSHTIHQHQTYHHDDQDHIILRYHQQQAPTSLEAPPTLHRPVHPPPPPPAPSSQYQVYQPSNLQTHRSVHNHNQQYLHHYANGFRPQVSPKASSESNSENNNLNNYHDHANEEQVQAILAAKEALEKPIEERDEKDILLIDNLCSLLHGFDVFPKTVRRALAAQAILIVIDEVGKELIVHNEQLDSFCVLIFGVCEQLNVTKTVTVRYYHVGDAFGVCEPTTDTMRFVGYMVTRCENCAFLCVKRDDFYTLLTDPANYPTKEIIRHRDRNGNVICVSQFRLDKKSSDPPWSHHMQSANPLGVVLPDGHIILKVSSCGCYTSSVQII